MKKIFFLIFAGIFILCIPWCSGITNYGDEGRVNSCSKEIKNLKDSLKKIEDSDKGEYKRINDKLDRILNNQEEIKKELKKIKFRF